MIEKPTKYRKGKGNKSKWGNKWTMQKKLSINTTISVKKTNARKSNVPEFQIVQGKDFTQRCQKKAFKALMSLKWIRPIAQLCKTMA